MKTIQGRCNLELHNSDCLEAMRCYGDNEFDLAICDPPYGLGYENGGKYFNKYQGKKWDKAPEIILKVL